tara:strand:- start:299 stop:514 length:216 start_codon:yes stop_codon:yes gene_type:complete
MSKIDEQVSVNNFTAHQKQLIWKYIKEHEPALALLMLSDEVSVFKNIFDAEVLMSKQLVFSAIGVTHVTAG